MAAMTVTATQGGSTANGLALRVFVLTGAAVVASQTGASTNNQFVNATSFTQSKSFEICGVPEMVEGRSAQESPLSVDLKTPSPR